MRRGRIPEVAAAAAAAGPRRVSGRRTTCDEAWGILHLTLACLAAAGPAAAVAAGLALPGYYCWTFERLGCSQGCSHDAAVVVVAVDLAMSLGG